MRGKEKTACNLILPRGITPACAGKSIFVSAKSNPLRDHPRVCGEKSALETGLSIDQGSPPRVRGKALVAQHRKELIGITPACAGKREFRQLHRRTFRDHPRVCGEKGIAGLPYLADLGSPPRVRGKAFSALPAFGKTGITPACAGKSQCMYLSIHGA